VWGDFRKGLAVPTGAATAFGTLFGTVW